MIEVFAGAIWFNGFNLNILCQMLLKYINTYMFAKFTVDKIRIGENEYTGAPNKVREWENLPNIYRQGERLLTTKE